MNHRLWLTFCLVLLPFGLCSNSLWAQTSTPPADPNVAEQELARRIDQLIEARWVGANIQPTARIDDAQFLRRLSLDLTGRIPSLLDLRDFIDPSNDNPNKRQNRIDQLLSNEPEKAEAYARHFAASWRYIMLQGKDANPSTAQWFADFESWLRRHLVRNTTYDQVARELLTSPPEYRGASEGSPRAFYGLNGNKAENLAGATARVFLGVSIECAQCHNHPFAKWQRQQFWEYAAFFANTQPKKGRPGFSDSREIRIPETNKVAKARFLDGSNPQWKPGVDARTTLAEWMISTNPNFARTAVDHLWQYFFGVSLLEPILEANSDNPTHPELLDTLAKALTESGYDLKFLVRSIVHTRAYQRSSAGGKGTKEELFLFARMPVRGLSPEQLYDSVIEATEYKKADVGLQKRQEKVDAVPRERSEFLAKFKSQDKRTDMQTSILQALFMMNGGFPEGRTRLENNEALRIIANSSSPQARKVETLYLMVLSRMPRAEESERLARYIDYSSNQAQAVADVYWALLNSPEFLLNH